MSGWAAIAGFAQGYLNQREKEAQEEKERKLREEEDRRWRMKEEFRAKLNEEAAISESGRRLQEATTRREWSKQDAILGTHFNPDTGAYETTYGSGETVSAQAGKGALSAYAREKAKEEADIAFRERQLANQERQTSFYGKSLEGRDTNNTPEQPWKRTDRNTLWNNIQRVEDEEAKKAAVAAYVAGLYDEAERIIRGGNVSAQYIIQPDPSRIK